MCAKETRPYNADKQMTKNANSMNQTVNEIVLKDGKQIQVLPLIEHVKYVGKQLNLVNHIENRNIKETEVVPLRVSYNERSVRWRLRLDNE